MKTIDITQYKGYLWYSDQSLPTRLHNQSMPLTLDATQAPFIVEGYLCNDSTSYSIRYIDGQYHVQTFDIKATVQRIQQNDLTDIIEYKGHHKLEDKETKMAYNPCFEQRWIEVCDPHCENMPTLQPGALVFVGFKTIKIEG